MNVQLDVFASNDINGDVIWSTNDEADYFEGCEFRIDLRGLGRGAVTFSRQVGEALLGNGILAPENFVRVLIPAISATKYVWGFFITERGLDPVDSEEEAGEDKKFGGPGPLFYLDRQIFWNEQFFDAFPNEGPLRIDLDNGIFEWVGDADIGNVLSRFLHEDANNTVMHALPDLTKSFDHEDDSNGVAWANDTEVGTEADPYTAEIAGPSFLHIMWAALDAVDSVEVTMNLGDVGSPVLELEAWQTYGRDLTGTSFASDTVILKEGVNIVGNLTSRGKSRKKATHVVAKGAEGKYGRAARPGWSSGDYAKAVGLDRPNLKHVSALERAGRRWLRKQDDGEDEITIGLGEGGFAPASGSYFPGEAGTSGHVWIGDQVSVKTGTDVQWTALDYHYSTELVTAIDLKLAEASVDDDADTQAKSWDVVLSLNVDRGSWSLPDRSGSGGGAHSHPPNPRLCAKARNVLEGLGLSSLKSYGDESIAGGGTGNFPRTLAVDGDDGTHWSGAPNDSGVTNAWFAADIGSSEEIDGFRILTDNAAEPGDAENVAHVVRLYATDDDAKWAALTQGSGLMTDDPVADLGWELVATHSTAQVEPSDSGLQVFPAVTRRYVLFKAIAGGSSEWDANEFEVWTHATHGTSQRASRCDHTHLPEDVIGQEEPTPTALELTDLRHGHRYAWLMAAFRSGVEELDLLISDDGKRWTELSANAFSPAVATVRDPSLVWENGFYWAVYTNRVAGNPSDLFGLAKSDDLTEWTEVTTVDMTAISGVDRVWAPQWFRDDDGSLHVFVSCSTDDGTSFAMYEVHPTNAAMTTWSTPVAVTGTGLPNMIDAFVVLKEGTYYLWYKNETTKFIEYASSSSLTSGYTVVESGNWAGWGDELEGMTLVHVTPNTWRIYFDAYNEDVIYWSESDDDWATWTTKVALDNPPYYTQHPHVLYADEVGGPTSGGGVSDHGELSGLGDDDHDIYLTTARHAALDHSGVGHYEVLMAGGVSPPEPLEDGTGTDWLYVWKND